MVDKDDLTIAKIIGKAQRESWKNLLDNKPCSPKLGQTKRPISGKAKTELQKALYRKKNIMTNAEKFISAYNETAYGVHQTALGKGWWSKERSYAEVIALMHSELSESLEAARLNDPADDKIPEFGGREAELADCIIRIMDAGEALGLSVAEALVAKIEFNKTREFRHGKKF